MVVVPDRVEAFVDLDFLGVLSLGEAEGGTAPLAEEEGTLGAGEDLGAHDVDVVGGGGRPDQDAVVVKAVR